MTDEEKEVRPITRDDLYTVDESGRVDASQIVRQIADEWIADLLAQGLEAAREEMNKETLTLQDIIQITSYSMVLGGLQLGVQAERSPDDISAALKPPTVN